MVVGWACLGGWVRERILMNTCLPFDECENGSDTLGVYISGFSIIC